MCNNTVGRLTFLLLVLTVLLPTALCTIECYVQSYVTDGREPTNAEICLGKDSCEKKYFPEDGHSEYLCGYNGAHEGCDDGIDDDGVTSIERCYCLDDLCNGGDQVKKSHFVTLASVFLAAVILW